MQAGPETEQELIPMVKVGLDEEGKKGRRKMKEEDEGKEGEKDERGKR